MAIFEVYKVGCGRERAFWMLVYGGLGDLVGEREARISEATRDELLARLARQEPYRASHV